MKKVLINGLLLNKEFAGVQYSIEYLLQELSQLYNPALYIEILLSKAYTGSLSGNKFFRLKTIEFNTQNRFKRIYFENILLPKYFKENNFDLYHSPGHILPYFTSIPCIVTIHDLIALDFPNLCQYETALYYNLFLPKSIEKSIKILAVSNTIKKDIITKFPKIKENKIEVIHHGVHKRFRETTSSSGLESVRTKYDLPSHFLLFVGNLEPKKNINKIIEAFIILKQNPEFNAKLVIVGKKGWKYQSIFELIKKHDIQEDVHFCGYVNEEDLPFIYTLADIFLFPSLYEGFGLPVLEAMACGCPVIVSKLGALPEISGNICPQVNPHNSVEIALTIDNLLQNKGLRNAQIELGLQWSDKFQWKISAKKTMDLYHSVLYN